MSNKDQELIQEIFANFLNGDKTRKSLEALEEDIFVVLKEMDFSQFLNTEINDKKIKVFFFNFFSKSFVEDVILEKVIIKNDFNKENLLLLESACEVNAIRAGWVEKAKINISSQDYEEFKKNLINKTKSIYVFNELKKIFNDFNEWEIIDKGGIATTRYAHWLGLNIFGKQFKKNPTLRTSKTDIFHHLQKTENQWYKIKENTELINRLVFPLLFFRSSKEKVEINNFIKKHKIELNLNTKVCYSDDSNKNLIIKEVLIQNGIFEFLNKEEKKELNVFSYMFSDVRFKKYVKTKNEFISLLNKKKDFFSNENLEFVFNKLSERKTFFFPLHHSCFLNGERNSNKEINIFEEFKEHQFESFNIQSRLHFFKSVSHINKEIFDHLKTETLLKTFSTYLEDAYFKHETKMLFNTDENSENNGIFINLLSNMSLENRNNFFNMLFAQNDEVLKKLTSEKEKIEVFANVLNIFKDTIVLNDMAGINGFKNLLSKNDLAAPILKILNNIYLNNTLEIKEDKKEKFFKI